MSVFLGRILVAEVALSLRVDSGAVQPALAAPPERSSAPVYRRIFASYSHRDAAVVKEFERYARAVGDEYMRDLVHLRTGEVWDERLREMIDQANVFQLFWSWNSMWSRFVEQEWRYALTLRRPNFIRPVYWQKPLPASPEKNLPPEELLRFHFQRVYIAGAASGPAQPQGTDAVRTRGARSGRRRMVTIPLEERPHGRLYRELKSAARLSHPGIVAVYDLSIDGDNAYISMEHVTGSDLSRLLKTGEPLDRETIFRILCQAAAALDYAHQEGVVHGDLNPENILLGEDDTVKIADFGLAAIGSSPGDLVGTLAYMSPEQVQGLEVDGRSDQFALAVIAYEMLAGEAPGTGERPTLGPEADEVLRKALAKDPRNRFATCTEFVEALRGTACVFPA